MGELERWRGLFGENHGQDSQVYRNTPTGGEVMLKFNHTRFMQCVNDRRSRRGMSWKDVSDDTGISRSNLSRSWRHSKNLSVDEMLTLADKFNLNINAFAFPTEPPA